MNEALSYIVKISICKTGKMGIRLVDHKSFFKLCEIMGAHKFLYKILRFSAHSNAETSSMFGKFTVTK